MAQSIRPSPYDERMLGSFDDGADDPEIKAYGSTSLAVSEAYPPHDDMPIFLSGEADETQHRFGSGGERGIGRAFDWSRILKVGIAGSAAAGIALAIMSMENPLSMFANAKASFGATEPAQPPQKIAAQPANPEPQAAATRKIQPAGLTSASPSRDEITAAYQSAVKTKVVAVEPSAREAAPPPPPTAPAARRIEPDELAMLLKRAKGLLAIGDITAARLLLERAADAQEAEAALMLAGTYDSQVLGTHDMRSVTPDPAAARLWYQKAAQLGSPDAMRRLSQLQN